MINLHVLQPKCVKKVKMIVLYFILKIKMFSQYLHELPKLNMYAFVESGRDKGTTKYSISNSDTKGPKGTPKINYLAQKKKRKRVTDKVPIIIQKHSLQQQYFITIWLNIIITKTHPLIYQILLYFKTNKKFFIALNFHKITQ